HLLADGRSDPRWMTYKQANDQGGQVRKGEKGTGITYWKFAEEQVKRDEAGNPVLDGEGNQVKEIVRLERPRAFFAVVFNAEQIDGLPALEKKELTWDPVERAERILENSGVAIKHHLEQKAFYRPLADTINLPKMEMFPKASNYYAAALHELGHSTGHQSRLNRDIRHPFGSVGYAKEELRAEIAAMMLGGELGIGHDPEQHAAYVGSWIKVLKEDPMEIMRAAADAEKIHNYVLGLEQKQIQEQTSKQKQAQVGEEGMQKLNTNTVIYKVSRPGNVDVYGFGSSYDEAIQAAINNEDVSFGNNHINQVVPEANVLPGAITFRTGIKDSTLKALQEDEFVNWENLELISLTAEGIEKAKEPITKDLKKEHQERIDLNVPFKEKNEAKALGAKWDRVNTTWYVPSGVNPEPFAKWHVSAKLNVDNEVKTEPLAPTKTERQYLAVPYEDRAFAKAAGAFWDKEAKSWYVGAKGDMTVLKQWLPENVKTEQAPAMRPEEEFADVLRSVGCIVTEDHPIMDGKKHRILVEDDKAKSHKMGSGFYIAHLDGRPNGYAMNNRTQVSTKWVAKGYSLDAAEKAQLAETAAIKLQAREEAAAARAKEVASAVSELLAVAPAAPADHSYLLKKQAAPGDLKVVPDNANGLPADTIIMIGADWKESKTLREENPDKLVFTAGDLLLAGHDINGSITTVQSIQQNGSKCYVKDSNKSGSFHVVGGMDALADAPAIVINEGYATGDSLSQALGFTTVTAFDSNNLKAVAEAMHERFPDKPIIIAGDDDLNQELISPTKNNPGKIKAMEAAKAVDGQAVFPIFAPGEQENSPKDFSDFNDLATKSSLGMNAVKGQINSAVKDVVEKHMNTVQHKQQEDEKKLVQQQQQVLMEPQQVHKRQAARR
ncbi:MAG: zincin-like metallopeptidase domain-containing protein, partial [Methylococcales bacterium]|nr:zincin-like metallopeptidase domain-containing protein [Methylococcales bacterium]